MIHSELKNINFINYFILKSKGRYELIKEYKKNNYFVNIKKSELIDYKKNIKKILSNNSYMVLINNNPKKKNKEVSFIFKIKNNFYEYILNKDNKEEILNLCNKIDKTQYKSINKMLLDTIYKENSITLNVNELDKNFVMECVNNLDINDLFEPYLVDIFKDLEKVHFDKNGYNNILDKYLNKEQKNIYLIYMLYYFEVINGGHLQFFGNSSRFLSNQVVDAFNDLKLTSLSLVLTEARSRLSLKKDPQDELDDIGEKQYEIFSDLDDKIYQIWNEEIESMIKNYIINNIDKFTFYLDK